MLEEIFFYMNQLVAERDFETSILILTKMGQAMVQSDRASFWYNDTANDQYWTIAALGSSRITLKKGTGIVGAVIEENTTVIINDPYKDDRFSPENDRKTGYKTESILCMPVTDSQGKVIGAFQAINKLGESKAFMEEDIKLLSLAVVYSGKTLETQLLFRESRVDQLTALLNRRGFFEKYEKNYGAKDGEEGSIIICDIDFFKKVNDTYGHNAGDAVLRHIARILTSKVDSLDVVCRWGGEEFVILLDECSIEQAAMVAERIRQTVEKTPCRFEKKVIAVTMSFGVNAIDRALTAEENVKIADEKLYTAKQTGRNRVVV